MVLKIDLSTTLHKSHHVSRLRSISSQFIASTSSFLLLFDLGMAINFTTIMIPALLNAKEGLSLDETQASWFGSVSFLTQPAGALLSGPVVDYVGRKKANFLVNIPMVLAWILMYYSWNLPSLFTANALLGISSGIMEAPINSYVGEISEPSIRGALCTVTQFFTTFGILIMYFMGTVVEWRTVALICLVAPAASMLMVVFAPETPVWLLTRERHDDALKSLCKLRGWTSPDNVREEFHELSNYSRNLRNCVICSSTDNDTKICPHDDMNWFQRRMLQFRYVMLCKETLRPLTLVMMYFLFFVMSGLTPIRSNLVNVCGAFGMAQDGKQIVVFKKSMMTTVNTAKYVENNKEFVMFTVVNIVNLVSCIQLMVGVLTFVTGIFVIGIIRVLGKRKLAISSLLGSAVTCLLLSIYAKQTLDDKVFSYDPETFPKKTSIVPLILMYLLTIFTGLGIPWVLLGEVFPFRSRANAQGLSAASNYVFSFLGSKTFINLETSVKLWGTFATYAAFGFIGTIYLYFFLPETEGKTLQEIEEFYNGDLRIFADDPIINTFRKRKQQKQ